MEAVGIDKGAAQIALVVDDHRRLLGTPLTDGDIRRGLLYGASMDTCVEHFMNKQFRFVRNNPRPCGDFRDDAPRSVMPDPCA